jgi:hypothetical protein
MSTKPTQANAGPVTKETYLSLASLLEGKDRVQRVHKKSPQGEALRAAGEFYGNREYVSAYECLKPAHGKVVSDMQRILARNVEFEANKIATEQRKPLAAAKEQIQKFRGFAEQVIEQFDRLLKDLENKALVRAHLKKRASEVTAEEAADEPPPTILNSAGETRLDAREASRVEIEIGGQWFKKAPYSPPQFGSMYCVRDKLKSERIIRVIAVSPNGEQVQVQILEANKRTKPPIQITAESLTRQAKKGWCNLLLPFADKEQFNADVRPPLNPALGANVTMRLDIQNFSRCCADIIRANIKFDTQRIKDVCDGPFRAGDYEQAFLTFEQFATGFNSAVGASRRAIADGRRELTAAKTKLSGKEIQDRAAAYTRSEHLIHTAEREFSTILEGLRMYLRAAQG